MSLKDLGETTCVCCDDECEDEYDEGILSESEDVEDEDDY